MVCQHFPGGTLLDHYIANSNPFLDEIVPHPDIIGSFTDECHPVPLEQHGAQIVLEKYALVDIETLGLDKISGPWHLWQFFAGSHQFRLCGNLSFVGKSVFRWTLLILACGVSIPKQECLGVCIRVLFL